MLFPTRTEIRKALVLALADGAPHASEAVEAAVADILGLSDSQRRASAGNGHSTRLGNEIDWIKGAGDTEVGLFERVGPRLYRLTPLGRSVAAGKIDLDRTTRTINSGGVSLPSDLERLLHEDAETLSRDPRNVPALNRTARRYHEQGEIAEAIVMFERVLAVEPNNKIALGRLRTLRG